MACGAYVPLKCQAAHFTSWRPTAGQVRRQLSVVVLMYLPLDGAACALGPGDQCAHSSLHDQVGFFGPDQSYVVTTRMPHVFGRMAGEQVVCTVSGPCASMGRMVSLLLPFGMLALLVTSRDSWHVHRT